MNKIESKFSIGDTLKDRVTGHQGVVMAIAVYATGCIHYGLQAQGKKAKESPGDWQYFDESRLIKLVKKRVVFDINKDRTGGPVPNPPQA